MILPWTNLRIEELKNQYEQRGDLERVEPGQFQESADGKRVFFIEKDVSGAQGGTNVFIATTEEGKETVTSARSGRIETLPTGRFLMLNNGQRLERSWIPPRSKSASLNNMASRLARRPWRP